jgi:hypothetical protein
MIKRLVLCARISRWWPQVRADAVKLETARLLHYNIARPKIGTVRKMKLGPNQISEEAVREKVSLIVPCGTKRSFDKDLTAVLI